MTTTRSTTRSRPRTRPAKPYPAFPLFAHATGRWAKKIRGKFAFFGPWDDPHGALEKYLDQRDALMAGLTPRESPGSMRGAKNALSEKHRSDEPSQGSGLTLRELVNRFLTAKQRKVEAGELRATSLSDYIRILGRMLKTFGRDRLATDLVPEDFAGFRRALAATRGPFALSSDITKVRTLFRFAVAEGLLEHLPRYGPGFDKPTRKAMRAARAAAGIKMFEPPELARLLDAAPPQMRAMILLGLNAGMGNTDVATLPRSAVDLRVGVIEYPRPKTGVARRTVLWPETIAALQAVAKVRPAAMTAETDRLVFVTKYGKPWARVQTVRAKAGSRGGPVKALDADGSPSPEPSIAINSVTLEFGKLLRELKLHRRGRSFYSLRHTFRTVADELGDRRAIDRIMGHESGYDVSSAYVERIADERLRKVAEHVRAWVFGLKSHTAI